MRVRNLLMLTLALLFVSTTIIAQQQGFERCHTVEADANLRALHPELGTLDEFEEWLAPKVREYKNSTQARAVVTIPIIFHVIHDNDAVGSGDNLSATLINAQLDQLNNDFRRIAGTSGFNNNAVGADTEIEFCAATLDPNGATLSEPGINRINRNSQGWSAPPYGTCSGGFNDAYIEGTIKPQSQWDPSLYFNFWVMDIDCGILGYAQFPSNSGLGGLNTNGGAASTDGVVILTSSVGSTTTPNPAGGSYNKGRTATHEVGHWIGLRHIWGDGGCTVDDFCNDTPTSDAANYGCPNHTSCGTTDMVENYMDYTDDDCMNIFTADQKARMQAVLANSPRRGSLTSSDRCGSGGNPGGGGLTCGSTISSFPYAEGFESGTGAWSQGSGDDFDWSRRSGSTPSSNTGPASASEGSFYMYTESSSPNYSNKVSIFTSPCFDLSSASEATFTFQYHMYGAAAMGGLVLEASADGNWSTVWSRSGNQGNAWESASVNLASYLGDDVQLRFVGTTGTTWQGDMAIDDIGLSTGGGGNPGGGCTDVTLSIALDQYPSETTWTITDAGGSTVLSGGSYSTANSTVTIPGCLDDGCYDFNIFDSYGDGICCAYGNGSYTLTDDAGNVLASGGSFGSSETTNFCLGGGGGNNSCPAIDFSAETINSYGGTQDQGTFTVQDGGATLFMTNNAWKSISLNYTVTANTVVEFDFRSTAQGEIHGIGFDSDNGISSNRTFRVYGTQNWGIGTYDNYSGTAWTTYTIPVGASYTGTFNRLFFTMDHDGGAGNGNAYFRNVKIYEGSCGSRTGAETVRTEWKKANELQVFPNPARAEVNLAFHQKVEAMTDLYVMDIMGKVVMHQQVETQEGENNIRLAIDQLQSGSYFVVVENEFQKETKQFVVID